MNDPRVNEAVHTLYQSRSYPPMSHPSADPAVVAATARLAGLAVPNPQRARILEIGCAAGHHLIPLAMRWPETEFTGIDFSSAAIAAAQEKAQIANTPHIRFTAADLRDHHPAETFDFIIAHGFLSWVPDDTKRALFDFISRHLAPNGIAVVSFNLACGWEKRFPVIEKTRAIQHACTTDEISALQVLREIATEPERAIIDDMLAKGKDVLPFDDFAPINDPCSLSHFVQQAARFGLTWLGESDASANLPPGMDFPTWRTIVSRAADLLSGQDHADRQAGRTFRSALLCHTQAKPEGGIHLHDLAQFHFRTKNGSPIHQIDHRALIARVHTGEVEARLGHIGFDPNIPAFPRLNAFRLFCANHHLPIVDAWHQPCHFPPAQFQLLAQIDGRRDLASLREIARTTCPALAFDPWLAHLAHRGFFS